MDEYQLISFIGKFGVEIPLISLLVYVIIKLLRTFCKKIPEKILSLTEFALSAALYALYLLIFKKPLEAEEILDKGIAIGGIAMLYSSLFDKISQEIADSGENAIEYLLETYVNTDDIKAVIAKIKAQNETEEIDKDKIKEILKNAAGENSDEDKLDLISEMIVKASDSKKNTKTTE